MNKMIYYPGLDPVDRTDLKTFIREDSNEMCDIVFFFHSSKHQHWNFSTSYKRDQVFAFLVDQLTDRPTGSLLNHYFKIGITEDPEDVEKIEISPNVVVVKRKHNVIQRFPCDGKNMLLFHLLIMDIMNHPHLNPEFSDPDIKPYPWNPLSVKK